MRLGKYLAGAGVASRRAAEELIRAGRVSVGAAIVLDPALDVDGSEGVALDGRPVAAMPERVVYALNKPPGVVSTAKDTHGRPTVVSLVGSPFRLYPIGRLDIDSTGLILLTNDGPLVHRLTHPSFGVPKTYRARVSSPPVREAALRALRGGVELEDGRTSPAQVRRLAPDHLEITLHEGRKRQVRRMCETVGHPVRALERIAFGPLSLGSPALGRHRRLSRSEVASLLRAESGSAVRPGAASSRRAPRRSLRG